MTYNDVYKKFMIEYDKADISSSYPPLTIYEVATILDKALLALIAQKVTGNNPRQTVLDSDIKSSSDIQKMLITSSVQNIFADTDFENEKTTSIPDNLLYLIKLYVNNPNKSPEIAQVISSIFADKYRKTSTNCPWLKSPVCFVADDKLHVMFDGSITDFTGISVTPYYVKKPNMFTDKVGDEMFIKTANEMPLSDSACEELINLAIIYACKIVENPRMATEIQTKSLEA